MDVIELRGVTFERQGRQILRDVSWRIGLGEHWALLGANGSGKTTLLKIITGYEWPSAGTVAVLGDEFGQCNLRELRKKIQRGKRTGDSGGGLGRLCGLLQMASCGFGQICV